ncbi:MAG: ABC-2 family transporter protein [Chthonomonadales bacterium]
MRYLKLLGVFYKASIQTDMEYRADFFTRVIASLFSLLTNLGAFTIAFHYTKRLGDWTLPQATVLLAIYYLMDGLIEMTIAPNMRQIMEQVRQGTLDFVLLKPVSPQFMASFRTINIWRMMNVLVGLGLSLYTISRLGLSVGPVEAAEFALTLLTGMIVVYSFWLFLVTLTFWFVRLENIEQIMWQAFEAARYPLDIYPLWLKSTLTYVIPVAFIISIPARALTGKLAISSLAVAVIVAVTMFVCSTLFWRFGLKRYTGASA